VGCGDGDLGRWRWVRGKGGDYGGRWGIGVEACGGR
jgi:hypothetical protein